MIREFASQTRDYFSASIACLSLRPSQLGYPRCDRRLRWQRLTNRGSRCTIACFAAEQTQDVAEWWVRIARWARWIAARSVTLTTHVGSLMLSLLLLRTNSLTPRVESGTERLGDKQDTVRCNYYGMASSSATSTLSCSNQEV